MPAMTASAYASHDWYLISLRPRGEHETMRRIVARLGGHLLAVSPWALQARDDDVTRARLAAALKATFTIVTSPAAARATRALVADADIRHTRWLAVGQGTARALATDDVMLPPRATSESLLLLPALASVRQLKIGLITAPGGRDLIAKALQQRGAELIRADVYDRVPLRISATTQSRLRSVLARSVLAVSSGEALQRTLAQLPEDLAMSLQQRPIIVTSARLAELARQLGFARIRTAEGPQPQQLARAAVAAATPTG